MREFRLRQIETLLQRIKALGAKRDRMIRSLSRLTSNPAPSARKARKRGRKKGTVKPLD